MLAFFPSWAEALLWIGRAIRAADSVSRYA
jgi:hypothetical protein